jgi:hypothetical protein
MRALAATFAFLVAAPALAHIELTFPPPRYPNNGVNDEKNKACPCGDGPGGQFCERAITSDANRSTTVTPLRPGATITIRWTETIGHRGRYRVAFDDDGADLADFNAHILGDTPDPSDGTGQRTMTVTLPSTPCTTCTLQLIQDMNGNDAAPVLDPSGDPTYFQCADIVLSDDAPDAGAPDAIDVPPSGAPNDDDGSAAEGEADDAATAFSCANMGASSGAVLLLGLLTLLARRRPRAVGVVATRSRRAAS